MDDVIKHEILKTTDDFIFGKKTRLNYKEEVQFTTETVQLTNEAHKKYFWFLQEPFELFRENNISVSKENCNYLQSIWEKDWKEGALYFLNACEFVYDLKEHGNTVANIIINDVQQIANEFELETPDYIIDTLRLNYLINLVILKKLDKKYIKEILKRYILGEDSFDNLVKDEKYKSVDTSIILEAVNKILEINKDKLDGSDKILNFLIGQVMRELKGKANASEIKELISERIKA